MDFARHGSETTRNSSSSSSPTISTGREFPFLSRAHSAPRSTRVGARNCTCVRARACRNVRCVALRCVTLRRRPRTKERTDGASVYEVGELRFAVKGVKLHELRPLHAHTSAKSGHILRYVVARVARALSSAFAP